MLSYISSHITWKIIWYSWSTINVQSSLSQSTIISETHYLCERREYVFMILRKYTIISPYHITISHFSSLLPTIISLLTFHLCITLNFNVTLHLYLPLRFILTLLIPIYYYLYILSHMKKVITFSLFLSLSCFIFVWISYFLYLYFRLINLCVL